MQAESLILGNYHLLNKNPVNWLIVVKDLIKNLTLLQRKGYFYEWKGANQLLADSHTF